MTDKELEDTKKLCRMAYAKSWFKRAREAANHLIKINLPTEDPLYYPCVSGIHILYAKPFTTNYGVGKLDKSFVPHEYCQAHRQLMALRHRMFAHLDVTESEDAFEKDISHSVYIRRLSKSTISLQTDEICSELCLIKHVAELCSCLEEKCAYHITKFQRKYRNLVPPFPGSYRVNITDKSKPMFELDETPPSTIDFPGLPSK